ncbi:MAG: PhoX family phosphatase [Cypionkella sp.]|nr:PhoX family phosphatase [Cypionkella sp.]MDZ4313099.1 PhoX family phosphatase [Cypionkella sp.]
MNWDAFDERRRPAPETVDFDRVVEAAMSRRGFLRSVVAFGSGAAAMGLGSMMSSTSANAQAAAMSRFAFTPIPTATDSMVHVPEGYSWKVVAAWGDALFSDAPAFDHENFGHPNSDRVFGENTDGMEMFNIDGHQVIAINHEYVNSGINVDVDENELPTNAADVLKLQNLQGITVMEVAKGAEGWAVVVDSPFNRRITNNTPMMISGPAAGHTLLQTASDPIGTSVLGTLNNCGSGRTPWGTYLTCEENFNGYFGSTNAEMTIPDGFDRYGIGAESGYAYEKFDARFDLAQNPNEPHRFGYVVEIDPSDAASTPVKRSALGRFKHENAASVVARNGRVVVYLGDDERGEFLYKYVSNGVYMPGGDTSTLLDDGVLYVAQFGADGSGQWLPLTPETTGMDAAMICIHTRQAASAVGATTMDRPEWVAVNPIAIEAYCALTNNSWRKADATNAGGDAMVPVEGSPNARAENGYGQIVRWYPVDEDHTATGFTWDLYVTAGNPTVHSDAYAGSANITDGNMFNSPDGMVFDRFGLLWIQTDGDDSNEGDFAGQGNNQMLVGDPATGEIARFLTGPVGSEVTGMTPSSDGRTIFVGIQHPGTGWPAEGLPRSAIIAVWRDDGALIA